MKRLRPILIACAFGVALLCVVRVYGVRFVLFPTWVLRKDPPQPSLPDGEVWTLDTDAGRVEAFFFPAASRAPTVIFTHGNGELIEDHLALARWYCTQGFTVLLPEYRGYGRSQGTPTEDSLVRDFVAFFDRLHGHPAVDSSRIYFHGRSLGGAVAVAAASKRAPRAMVLESTFSSIVELARERGFPSFLVAKSFDSRSSLRNSSFPVLLLHGTRDDIVPFVHARQLAEVIPRHTVVPLDCRHNDCPLATSDILRFLRNHAE
jgi:pimeloyl-ACP methyl ester carboxylesterase